MTAQDLPWMEEGRGGAAQSRGAGSTAASGLSGRCQNKRWDYCLIVKDIRNVV